MKKRWIRMAALVLCAAMLCGCAALEGAVEYALESMGNTQSTIGAGFAQMEYQRPDMQEMERSLEEACQAAQGEEMDAIVSTVNAFYEVYDSFFTNYSLADLHYCHDMTDEQWEEEYNYCLEQSSRVDAALQDLYYALAASPLLEELESEENFGPGFFDAYQGENRWEEEILELMNQETALQSKYYELSNVGAEYEEGTEAYYAFCGEDMAQLLVELIGVRQEIAAYWGYDSYAQYATDAFYYRDYTLEQSAQYLEEIRTELVPLYQKMNRTALWDEAYTYSTERQTYAYVENVAKSMGGMVERAFKLMDRAGLYDIGYGENKYPASFEVYLTSYSQPFIFMNPDGSNYDHLTFAHEFGHFCNDYASYGSYAGVDVLEFFSQGMEYLSLCYGEDTEDLIRIKMADSLCLFVEQAAFASFEMGMYALTGEELTAGKLQELYETVALSYGLDSAGFDPREFVSISHFYTSPMYIMSYVVSNDAAMQLYQLELEDTGKGLKCYMEHLNTGEQFFLAFLESVGMESPFAPGRVQKVRETFTAVLG